MKTHGRVKAQSHTLTSALDGVEQTGSCPGRTVRLTPTGQETGWTSTDEENTPAQNQAAIVQPAV
jgi:hypothetical protein